MREFNFEEVSIELACEIFISRFVNINNPNSFDKIILDYESWVGTGAEDYLSGVVFDMFGHKGERHFYKTIENMLKPISERKFFECRSTDGGVPFYANIGYKDVFIYVYDEFEGRYGKQFRIACNCEDSLYHTYSRKQINETLEVGKFYRICLEEVRSFGNGYKKYCYDIEEIDEEEYIKRGIFTRSHLTGW